MTQPLDIKDYGAGTVYMKPILVADLPSEIRDQAGEAKEVIVVHNHEGETLAFVADLRLARHLAREHNMQPVLLH